MFQHVKLKKSKETLRTSKDKLRTSKEKLRKSKEKQENIKRSTKENQQQELWEWKGKRRQSKGGLRTSK